MLPILKRQADQMSVGAQSGSPPVPPESESQEPTLSVTVVFTSIRSTLAALKAAGVWASRLGAHITLLAPQVVPYPLPLAHPDVEQRFSEHRFRVLAEESKVETDVRLLWCRDTLETVLGALAPHSLVMLGSQKSWLPTSEKRLARQLRRAGHEVIVTETE
jgi:hypothetical protein